MRGLPIRTELSAAELRALARRETRPRVAPRLYATAHVLDGVSRTEAARLCGMDKVSLHRLESGDTDGLLALVARKRGQAEEKLSRPVRISCCVETAVAALPRW